MASVGLRTRRLRAGLSALGIAIGVASIVAVLGLSSSSQAGLLREIDRLGTNLLTVTKGQTFTGAEAELPVTAPSMIERIPGVERQADTGLVQDAKVYRSPLIPSAETNGLQVQAASLNLLPAIVTQVAQGRYLNAATAREPVAVLGAVHCIRTHAFINSRIFDSTSAALNGLPCTLENVCASTRNSARSSFESWPRFSSGTITVR